MLRDRVDGTWHCTLCPGEGWLLRRYGQEAAAALRGLRAGVAPVWWRGPFDLDALIARYPETSGRDHTGSRPAAA
jgi:hypothetical protein